MSATFKELVELLQTEKIPYADAGSGEIKFDPSEGTQEVRQKITLLLSTQGVVKVDVGDDYVICAPAEIDAPVSYKVENTRPTQDRIIVRVFSPDDKSMGGIIIPQTAKEIPNVGEVVKVGKGLRDEKGKYITPETKKGDKILFGQWAGTPIEIDKVDYLIMRESDILMYL